MVLSVCTVMKTTTAYRVAITQIVILLLYSVVLFCLGAYTLDDLELEEDQVSKIRKGFYVCAGFYLVPLILAVVLTFGVFKRNVGVVRMWILLSILETVILLAITTAGCIYFAVTLDSYHGVTVIALQIIVTLWKMECIVMINDYYREDLLGGIDPKLVA